MPQEETQAQVAAATQALRPALAQFLANEYPGGSALRGDQVILTGVTPGPNSGVVPVRHALSLRSAPSIQEFRAAFGEEGEPGTATSLMMVAPHLIPALATSPLKLRVGNTANAFANANSLENWHAFAAAWDGYVATLEAQINGRPDSAQHPSPAQSVAMYDAARNASAKKTYLYAGGGIAIVIALGAAYVLTRKS